MPVPRLPSLLVVLALAAGASGCGDDEPTTFAVPAGTATATVPQAGTVPPSVEEAQGSRGGVTQTAPTPAPAAGPLDDYVAGGRTAPEGEARTVRAAFRAFAKAISDRDARAVCSRAVGFEELLKAQGAGAASCVQLFQNVGNGAAGPSDRDLGLIAGADVVVAGDRATLTVGGQTPVPMRRVRGAWKVDYAAFSPTDAPKG